MSRAKLAWSLWGLCVALVLGSLVFVGLAHGTRVPGKNLSVDVALTVLLLAFPTVGALIASRLPGNPIGWLLIGVGLAFEVGGFAQSYAAEALFAAQGSLPGGDIAALVSEWLYVPTILFCTVVLLIFPHGQLLPRRWRPV